MARTERDLRIAITSTFNDDGTKSAQKSAEVLSRELDKLETAERRLVQMQMQAAGEMAAAEEAKAAAVVAANQRQAAAMERTGKAILAATTAAAVGVALSVKAASDWESQWTGVTKTVDGSAAQMGILETQLRSLATSLPATHEEIAKVAENAGQLGVKRADVAAFTRTMVDLGQTTNLSADEASTSIAQFSNIMGIGADKASRLGSTLVALGNDGASTEADIMHLSLRVAAAGRSAGMSADEVLSLASALSSTGLEAEGGGTSISRVINQIDSDVKSGKDTIAEYARVAGVSADEFAAKWSTTPVVALQGFTSGLGRMTAAGEDTTTTLEGLGFADERVADTLRRAALAGDLLADALTTGSEAWAENLALTQEAEKRYGTTTSQLAIAKNQITDTAISVGAELLPALASGADSVASLAAGFDALPGPLKEWVEGLGGAALGLGLVVGGAAVVIPKLQELSVTINALHGGSSTLGRALGSTASVLSGPWGVAIAGAGALLALVIKQHGDAVRAAQEYAATLDEETGAITDNTRAKAAADLQDQGALDAARALGLELKTVTDAALGNVAAMEKVAIVVQGVRDRTANAQAAGEGYTDKLVEQENASGVLERALGNVGDALDGAKTRSQNLREATDTTTSSTKSAADTQTDWASTLSTAADATTETTDAIAALAKELDNLTNPALNAREAERRFQEALDEVTASIEENGTTLDINTAAGRTNQGVLDGMAEAGKKRAQTVLEQTQSEDQFRAALDTSRQSLHDAAIQFGLSEDAAWAYVDEVLAVPAETTTNAVFDTVDAEADLARFKGLLAMPQVVITAQMRTDNPFYANRREGAVVDYFANGAEDHVADIAPAGSWRVWAEPETGGEAYIPLAESKRSRSEQILANVASRFGGVYLGAGAQQAGGGSSSVSRTTNISVTNSGSRSLTARDITWAIAAQDLIEPRMPA